MNVNDLPAGLMVVHGNRPESLRDLLVTWTKRYPLAPLENEIILVQSNGIAQWLKLALATDPDTNGSGGGCGIAAAIEMSLPARFLWRVYRAVLGAEAVPEVSPFDESRLIWRLMRLLPAQMERPQYAPLRRFLAEDEDCRKRFQLAERLADLLDQYQVYRADWLDRWAAGRDELIDAQGKSHPVPEEQRWQPDLWRALLADVVPTDSAPGLANTSRAAIHETFLRIAADWPKDDRPAGLPRRVLVFGISSLPRQSLEVLTALARWSQVLMCVHNPCEYFWSDIVADRDLLRKDQGRQPRRAGSPEIVTEESLHLHAHPLLAAWGRQGRDFIALLDEQDSAERRQRYLPRFAEIGQRIDLFESFAGDTLLQQLQDDIRCLRPLAETCQQWPPVDPERDRSICFQIAHSPQREVEILHDQLLAAFNDDDTLKPNDIIVMVPDIDRYTPSIQAVFGLLDDQDPRYVPFTVADQNPRAFDPLLHAVEKLLGVTRSRWAASDVLDLLEVPALRRRFGITESELPLLQRWIRGANIRWGLHSEQRAGLDLPKNAEAAAQNTWLFGLRRMLLGYAVGASGDAWCDIDPFDEIGGLDAAALGPLVRLLDRLDDAWRTLATPAVPDVWCDRLRELLQDFFLADSKTDGITILKLETALQNWHEACREAGMTESLPLSVVADHWLAQVEERGLTQRFFGGAVTFATLMPMRAIPFRRVYLMGMNDGDYPRTRTPSDFDLMGKDYRPGDRSRREDDRYLFLEAVLSARDALSISWVGRSIHDNTERPPSVLVGQLRDHLAAAWRLAAAEYPEDRAGGDLVAALTTEHRLQPFSPDYFPADRRRSPLFTYAKEWCCDTARAVEPGGGMSDSRLPPMLPEEPLTLRDLSEFLRSPVRAFFRQRLATYLELDDPASADQEPFVLDGLGLWQLQHELIQLQREALDRNEDLEAARTAGIERIRRRGELAEEAFGTAMAQQILEPMAGLFDAYRQQLDAWPQAQADEEPIRFELPIGEQSLQVADWCGGLRTNGAGARARIELDSSNLVDSNNRYRCDKIIRYWVTHLALQLADGPVTTIILSKKGKVTLQPMAGDTAREHLATLLRAWHDGMQRPLPLAATAGFTLLREGNDKARLAYDGNEFSQGEVNNDRYLHRAYPDFASLTASGEFAMLAETLYRPLFEAIPSSAPKADAASRPESATGADT